MNRETRIGILALAAILLFIFGYQYLKGKNLLGRSQTYYARYDNVSQLKTSDPVLLNGYQVGLVQNVRQDPENLNKLIVSLTLDSDVRIPDETVAEINTTSVMGGKAIILNVKGECCKESGDFIEGRTLGMLNSMVGTEDIETYMTLISESLSNLADTLINKVSGSGAVSGTGDDLQAIVSNLRTTTSRLNGMLASNGSLAQSLENVAGITGTIDSSRTDISGMLENLNQITADLQAAGIDQTVGNLNARLDELQGTLDEANNALSGITALTDNLQGTDNTLGLLLNERELYDQLDVTLVNLELLLQDIRLHPKRYTRILKKKEIPYEPPTEDPGLEEDN